MQKYADSLFTVMKPYEFPFILPFHNIGNYPDLWPNIRDSRQFSVRNVYFPTS